MLVIKIDRCSQIVQNCFYPYYSESDSETETFLFLSARNSIKFSILNWSQTVSNSIIPSEGFLQSNAKQIVKYNLLDSDRLISFFWMLSTAVRRTIMYIKQAFGNNLYQASICFIW